MNTAHAHLVVNHFPIVGLILGILVMLIGVLAKSTITRRVALFLFFIAGITAMISVSTGEGAEEIVEQLSEKNTFGIDCPDAITATVEKANETHFLIHEHEEKAEELMPIMWGLMVLSLIALFLEFKKKSMAFTASIIVLLIAVIAVYFAKEVGTSGGEISHPEIRKEFKVKEQLDLDED